MNATKLIDASGESINFASLVPATVALAAMSKSETLLAKCCRARGLLALIMAILTVVCMGEEYLCIDVSDGVDAQAFPVSRMDKVPDGGWGDEYKTDKIVLRKIHGGDKAFYIGVFEITQRQWELVTGKRPSYYKNDTYYAKRPVEKVSYDDIRGRDKGSKYPISSAVDENSFVGILRSKSKLTGLDIPTRRQWELACHGPLGREVSDPVVITKRDRFSVNTGFYLMPKIASQGCTSDNGTAEVGSYVPNDYGLYDMEGNVTEWCLDVCSLHDENLIRSGVWQELRPFGVKRVLKGGNCEFGHCGFRLGYEHYIDGRCGVLNCTTRLGLIGKYCPSSVVFGEQASMNNNNIGLRVVVVL